VKKKIGSFLMGFLALAMFAGCAHGPATGPSRLKVGDRAPTFTLADLETNQQFETAKGFPDHVVTVEIIWSMACPTCREALLECERVYQKYSGQSILFLGVNFDKENLNGIRAFIKSQGITFPILWDPRARVTRAYRALDFTFSAFVVDREGRLRWVQYDHPPDFEALLTQAMDKTIAEAVRENAGEKR